MQHDEVIPILDFGSQYAQLIARRRSMRALPHTYRDVQADAGTTLRIVIEGAAGGIWTLRREANCWRLYAREAPNPAATVTLSDDTAWRLFTKGLAPDVARARVRIEGHQALGAVTLRSLAVMA